MKKFWGFVVSVSILIGISYYFSKTLAVKESIIFFPLSEEIEFTEAITTLSLIGKKSSDKHVLEWDVHSKTNEEIYLRQDLSLLFVDGKLTAKLAEWEDQSQMLAQYEKVTGEDSNLYEAVSFHYGEVHVNDDAIESVQQMSQDYLYVIDSSFSKLSSFRVPSTDEEKEWKDILDHIQSQQLQYKWDRLFDHFKIDPSMYEQIPLTDLPSYNSKLFPGFTEKQTQTIIGTLWEGLYKEFFLGLKRKDGSVEDPLGSSVPLILIAKDRSHLRVLIEGKNGYPYQLYQRITMSED